MLLIGLSTYVELNTNLDNMDETKKAFKESVWWIRLAVCLNKHLKQALIDILHNNIKSKDVTGVPADSKQLYQFLFVNKNILDESLKKKVLKKEQYLLLLPNNKCVDTSQLDITLVRYLIRTFCGLFNAKGNWSEPDTTDCTIAAYIYRATGIRNDIFHYKNIQLLDKTEFEKFWKDINEILKGLLYKEDIEPMKTENLDHVSVEDVALEEFFTHLQDYKTECANESFQMKYIPRQFRDAQRDTIVTDLAEILGDNDDIIIHGEAGLGKSFTARYLIDEWSKDRLLNDMHIIFFNSKYVNKKVKVHSNAAPLWFSDITTVLRSKGKTIEDLTIFNCVKSAIKNLLVIVDSIDEFPIKSLVNEEYLSELEEKILKNDEISATDTIIGIYFGFFFPTAKIYLFGRTGEFERLRSLNVYPTSSIFKKKKSRDFELLPFNAENVKAFACLKTCKKQSAEEMNCMNLCYEIYEKIKDIELCKIPTDLNSLIKLFQNKFNDDIGRITKTKLFIATLFNRFDKHTGLKNILPNTSFRHFLIHDSNLANAFSVLCRMSFHALLEGNVTIKVKEVMIEGTVHLRYKQDTIPRDFLEQIDFFYIRDLTFYFMLEPYYLTNMEFLASCYLFSNDTQWNSLLELNSDRKLIILMFLAGFHSEDYFTQDFVTTFLNKSCYSSNTFFEWLFGIEDVRKALPNGHNFWYGLMPNNRLSPSFYLLDAIHRELEVPRSFIPKTIVCFSPSSTPCIEWYEMKYLRHYFITKKSSCHDINIGSFTSEFDSFKFLIKCNIAIYRDEHMKKLCKFYGHKDIEFRINHFTVKIHLIKDIKGIKSNSLQIFTPRINDFPFFFDSSNNIKKIDILESVQELSLSQTHHFFKSCLNSLELITLHYNFFTPEQVQILKSFEQKYGLLNILLKQMDVVDIHSLLTMDTINKRHLALFNLRNLTGHISLFELSKHITVDKNQCANLEKYKIINPKVPLIRKYKSLTNASKRSFYLHVHHVKLTHLSSKSFATAVSCIPSLECQDDENYIPSTHWQALSIRDDCHINELRIWWPIEKNLEYFLKIKTSILQLICASFDSLIELIKFVGHTLDPESDKKIRIFIVMCDKYDWDRYKEEVIYGDITINELKENSSVYDNLLEANDIDCFHEGELNLKHWCCEIRSKNDGKQKVKREENSQTNKYWEQIKNFLKLN